MDISFTLARQVSLITPARYLFRAGFTPEAWNEKILHDEHFRIVWYRLNSSDVFPYVEIKGGVAVMYRDALKRCGEVGTFKAYPELESIHRRVKSVPNQESLCSIIYAESSYRFNTDNRIAKRIVEYELNNDKKLISNIFDKLPGIFTERPHSRTVGIYGRSKGQRCVRYVDRALLEPHPNMDRYKVLVPESNGSGAIGEVLSTPLIGDPLIAEPINGATQTFLTIGAFHTRVEAEACLKYIKTKFARALLGILKVTQHNPKATWRLVPLQDFTQTSDIAWNNSVEDIDRQLYAKYGLTENEVLFVESMIRPMR